MFNRTIRIYSYLFLNYTIRTWVLPLLCKWYKLWEYITLHWCHWPSRLYQEQCYNWVSSDLWICHQSVFWHGSIIWNLTIIWYLSIIWYTAMWKEYHLVPNYHLICYQSGTNLWKSVNIYQCLKESSCIIHTLDLYIHTYIGLTQRP